MSVDPGLTAVRTALLAERQELVEQLGGQSTLAGSHYDANFADSSQVTAERGEAEALETTLKETLEDVEDALGRLDDGSYGVCESCGEAIPPARLEAMPTARRCMNCASKR